MGYGEKFDEKKVQAHKAGTYFSQPANTPHFGMTKEKGASPILLWDWAEWVDLPRINGVGSTSTICRYYVHWRRHRER